MKTVIHVGAGGHTVPEEFWPRDEWREISVDLDPTTGPDIVADICEIPLDDETGDAMFCSHVLEHVAEIDLTRVLSEFHRLLKPGGQLVIQVPDIQEAAQWIADGRGHEAMYHFADGVGQRAARPLDLIYGSALDLGVRPLMGHRTGFTSTSLSWWLAQAGFDGLVHRTTQEYSYSLVAVVSKNGHAPLFETLNPDRKQMILVTEGETVESHPEIPPEPAPEPTLGHVAPAGVGDHARVEIVDPPLGSTSEDSAEASDEAQVGIVDPE
jgi:SAM-dependent methyltransferase